MDHLSPLIVTTNVAFLEEWLKEASILTLMYLDDEHCQPFFDGLVIEGIIGNLELLLVHSI